MSAACRAGGNAAKRLGVLVGMVVTLVAVLAAPASASSRAPSNRLTFGIAPASAHGADGRPYLSYGVTPGASLEDHVAVLNYSSVAVRLQVYAVDAVETSSGTFGLLPAGARSTGVGAWISLPARFVNVLVPARSAHAPGEVLIPLAVRVPVGAAPGDHSGGVVASLRSTGTNASGQSVVLVQRVGVRVFVQVSGVFRASAAVADLHATYQGTPNPLGRGSVRISYVVRNTGNVDLSVAQRVVLSGLIGDGRQAQPGAIAFLLPGASVSQSVYVAGVWPQIHLQASVRVLPTVVAGTGRRLGPVTASTTVWAVPWPAFVALVLLVAAVVLSLRLKARLGARQASPRPQVAQA